MRRSRPADGSKPHVFHILLALAERDQHGLDIMRDVLERTDGQVHLWPAALYGTLRELVEAGLVEERAQPRGALPGGGRPRYYHITAAGRAACAAEAQRMAAHVRTARLRKVLTSSPRARSSS